MIGRKNPAHGSDGGRQSHLIRRRKLDPDTEAYLLALFRDPCAYCGDASATLDHIDSAHAGGGDGWDNLIGACSFCNASKATARLISYLGWRAYSPERVEAQRVLAEVTRWRKVGL